MNNLFVYSTFLVTISSTNYTTVTLTINISQNKESVAFMRTNNSMAYSFVLMMCFSLMFTVSVVIVTAEKTNAADQFTVESITNVQNTNGPFKLKLITSANGDTKAKKTGVISEPNPGSIDIPFNFKKKNGIVTAGINDEYFVCGYILDAKTGLMMSYVCNEGDLQNPDGINAASLSSFLTVPDGQNSKAKDVKINILVPLYDRLDVHKIKVVAMVKGEFQSKVIDAEGANGKTISVMFTFDRNTDIGKIQEGDQYFTCVSANELNPPEGTECEKRHIKSFDEPNVLAAR